MFHPLVILSSVKSYPTVSCIMNICTSVFVSILNYISIFSVGRDGSPPSPGPSVEDFCFIFKFSSSITSCLKPDPFSL